MQSSVRNHHSVPLVLAVALKLGWFMESQGNEFSLSRATAPCPVGNEVLLLKSKKAYISLYAIGFE